ncbi:MAG: dynamin family protein [Deferribacterales bacterium]
MSNISKFYDNIKEFKQSLGGNDGAQKIIDDFVRDINSFDTETKSISKRLKKKYGNTATTEFIANFAEFLSGSIENLNRDLEKKAKGEKLRKKAEGNFLVIIYGKVKAGKSTLGNYVAAQAREKGASPNFFTFDKSNKKKKIHKLEEIEEGEFATKKIECTNTIQGFEISGLTWIDTPGLGSMTTENGKLAEEYIEAADLIIYPVSSDSPGRRTDTEELRKLAEKRKEFLVLILKSDTNEEDQIDDEIVNTLKNKSEADRKEQEEQVRKEIKNELEKYDLKASNHLIREIISISVITAKHYEPNHEEWQKSNITKFYSVLNDVLQKEAKRLKSEQPMKNISALMNKYVLNKEDSLSSLVEDSRIKVKTLEERFKKFRNNSKNLIVESIDYADGGVHELLSQIREEKLSSKEISSRINKIAEEAIRSSSLPKIQEILSDFTKEIIKSFPMPKEGTREFELRDKIKTITITNETLTKATGSAIGAAIGGLAGAFFGPVGAAAGVIAGGAIGSGLGGACSSIEHKDIVVGDNFDEVEHQVKQATEEIIGAGINSILESCNKELIVPMCKTLYDIIGNAEAIVKNTEASIKK